MWLQADTGLDSRVDAQVGIFQLIVKICARAEFISKEEIGLRESSVSIRRWRTRSQKIFLRKRSRAPRHSRRERARKCLRVTTASRVSSDRR
jgi:hypothetical protein